MELDFQEASNESTLTNLEMKVGPISTPTGVRVHNSIGDKGGRTWQAFGGGKKAMKPFVKRVITIFATNASFLRVISNFRI